MTHESAYGTFKLLSSTTPRALRGTPTTMTELLEVLKIVDGWIGKDPWKFSILFSLAVLFRLGTIYRFWEVYSERDLRKWQKALERGYLDKQMQGAVEEKINALHFYLLYKIKTDKFLRKEIIDLCEWSSGRLNYLDFRRAQDFLRISKKGLEIRETNLSDRLLRFSGFSFSAACFVLAFSCMTAATFFPVSSPALLYLSSMPLVSSAFFFSSALATPPAAAEKIRQELICFRERRHVLGPTDNPSEARERELGSTSDFLTEISGLGRSGQGDVSSRDEEILASEVDPVRGWGNKPQES